MSGASTLSSTYRSAGDLSLHTRVGLVLCLLTASLLGVLGGLWLQGTRSAIHQEVEAATRVSGQWLKVVLTEPSRAWSRHARRLWRPTGWPSSRKLRLL